MACIEQENLDKEIEAPIAHLISSDPQELIL